METVCLQRTNGDTLNEKGLLAKNLRELDLLYVQITIDQGQIFSLLQDAEWSMEKHLEGVKKKLDWVKSLKRAVSENRRQAKHLSETCGAMVEQMLIKE